MKRKKVLESTKAKAKPGRPVMGEDGKLQLKAAPKMKPLGRPAKRLPKLKKMPPPVSP